MGKLDRLIEKAIFSSSIDPSGKKRELFGKKFPKRKKKKKYTRIDQIMDMFGVKADDAQIWASSGYTDEMIKKALAKR